VYGIAYTDDGSPTGKIVSWKSAPGGRPMLWTSRFDALERLDLDGWTGYVMEYHHAVVVSSENVECE
jgi:hypothetical protein